MASQISSSSKHQFNSLKDNFQMDLHQYINIYTWIEKIAGIFDEVMEF